MNDKFEEIFDKEAETNEDQFVISKEIEEEIVDESPIDCIDEKDQDLIANIEGKEEIFSLLDTEDTKDDLQVSNSFSGIQPKTDNELQMEIDDCQQDREEAAPIFELQLDEHASVIDQDTSVEIISSEFTDVEVEVEKYPMPLTIEEVDPSAVDTQDEQYPDEPLDEEDREIEVRSIQEDNTSSLTSNRESEEVAIHIDEETEDDNIEEVMRDDESSHIIHEQISDRNKSVKCSGGSCCY